jgi:hypothetical protein
MLVYKNSLSEENDELFGFNFWILHFLMIPLEEKTWNSTDPAQELKSCNKNYFIAAAR